MHEAVAVVLAAGSGERLGSPAPKAFIGIRGRPMLVYAASAALASPDVGWVVAAVPAGFEDLAHAMLEPVGAHSVVVGGDTRQASVMAALAVVPEEAAAIACHDAARPFASSALFGAALRALDDADGAVPVVPIPDTVKRIRDGIVVATEPREDLALAQTPQAFRASALRDALARAADAGLDFTDEAGALEWAGYRVRVIEGEVGNFKITTAHDLELAERAATEPAHG